MGLLPGPARSGWSDGDSLRGPRRTSRATSPPAPNTVPPAASRRTTARLVEVSTRPDARRAGGSRLRAYLAPPGRTSAPVSITSPVAGSSLYLDTMTSITEITFVTGERCRVEGEAKDV